MALARWQLLREIVLHQPSGTLVVQWGRDYLHWCVDSGNLVCVTSTLAEHSFTQLILQNTKICREELLRSQLLVDESKPLGAILLQRNLITREELRQMLFQHWRFLTYFLFLSASYVFWSPGSMQLKSDLVRADVPFSELILCCERSSIEVSGAIRLIQELAGPYRLRVNRELEGRLDEKERKVLQYVKAGCSLGDMFRDAELDRMACYRTLFLLWLSGYLSDSGSRPVPAKSEARKSILHWVRSFPPDWIFPLVGGVIIGVLLAPTAPPPKYQEAGSKTETWKEIREKPAWSPTTEEEQPQMNTDEHK